MLPSASCSESYAILEEVSGRTLNVYGHLMKGRDDAHKGTAEELAEEILGKKRRGDSAEMRV